MQPNPHTQPLPNVLYGVTHDEQLNPVVRTPRTVKVGIGRPAGKDISVYINLDGKWVVRSGKADGILLATKIEAQRKYREMLKSAPDAAYPTKLAYFTFTKLGSSGLFEPDWEAIEKHGPIPTEIDVIFTDDQPLDAAYQMWSANGLQCHGDGINAWRLNALAKTPQEKALAEAAKAAGQKYFLISEGCYQRGCLFAKQGLSKPHARLSFQLVASPRLGGKACFDTTSFRSIANLFSCLQEFRMITGQGNPDRGFVAGIPLKLVLRPHKVHPEGKPPSTAYGVSLEFRAEDVYSMMQRLIESGLNFKRSMMVAPPPVAQIAGPVEQVGTIDGVDVTFTDDAAEDDIPASAMASEFYPESAPDEPVEEPSVNQESSTVAAKTAEKTEELKGKLAEQKARKAAKADPVASAEEPPAASPFPPDPDDEFGAGQWPDK